MMVSSMPTSGSGVLPQAHGSFEQQHAKIEPLAQVSRNESQSPPRQLPRQAYQQDQSTPEPNVQQQPSPAQTQASPQQQAGQVSPDQASPDPSTDAVAVQDELICKWKDCRERFETAEQLYDHLCDLHVGRKSNNNLSLTCAWDNCSTSTIKRDHITSHIRVHVPLKPHKCQACVKSFKRPQDLKKHFRTHNQPEDPVFNGRSMDNSMAGPSGLLVRHPLSRDGFGGYPSHAAHQLRPPYVHPAPSNNGYYTQQPSQQPPHSESSPYMYFGPPVTRADYVGAGHHNAHDHHSVSHTSQQQHQQHQHQQHQQHLNQHHNQQHHSMPHQQYRQQHQQHQLNQLNQHSQQRSHQLQQQYDATAASGSSLYSRKRSPDVMRGMLHDFLGSVKKHRFDSSSYSDINESLGNIHGTMLATDVGGPGIGADYMPQASQLLQNPTHAPALGGPNLLDQQHAYSDTKYTRDDLVIMGRAVTDMRATVYEMPHSAQGIHQHHRSLDAMSPALAVPTTNAYTTTVGIAHMPSPRNSVSPHASTVSPPAAIQTHATNHEPTPSLSPPSRHSPINQHTMSRMPLYPHVSTSSDMFPSQAPPATLGASYDHGRRFSGGTLQSARIVLPERPRNKAATEETVEEEADTDEGGGDKKRRGKSLDRDTMRDKSLDEDDGTPARAAGSPHRESTTPPEVRATCDSAQAYDRWIDTMRILEQFQEYIQDLLKRGEYAEEPEETDKVQPPLSSPVLRQKSQVPLYPEVKI